MDFTLLSSIVTVVSLVVFVGIMLWAFSRNNKERFEELARSTIDNDTETTGN
jgi:cytochrome c oxidase cbb3-type subunit IV